MWSKMASGYWTYQDDQGVALVESLRDGTWRWEGHAIGRMDLDMDGWWGIAKTEEEAKREAEKYLTHG